MPDTKEQKDQHFIRMFTAITASKKITAECISENLEEIHTLINASHGLEFKVAFNALERSILGRWNGYSKTQVEALEGRYMEEQIMMDDNYCNH